jgi:N-acetyl-anhydromuramoyl-L-alanine amidase
MRGRTEPDRPRRGSLRAGADGWVTGAQRIESPNSDERPDGQGIELAVIHGISLPPGCFGGPGVIELFTNCLPYHAHPYYEGLRDMRVSAHFLIRRGGHLVQFVSCLRRAWHAGVSSWHGRVRCNDFSIGIEFEGADDVPYEAAQYRTCRALIIALRDAYPLQDIVGHSDIAPGRKTDPGPCFDWTQLRRLPRKR